MVYVLANDAYLPDLPENDPKETLAATSPDMPSPEEDLVSGAVEMPDVDLEDQIDYDQYPAAV